MTAKLQAEFVTPIDGLVAQAASHSRGWLAAAAPLWGLPTWGLVGGTLGTGAWSGDVEDAASVLAAYPRVALGAAYAAAVSTPATQGDATLADAVAVPRLGDAMAARIQTDHVGAQARATYLRLANPVTCRAMAANRRAFNGTALGPVGRAADHAFKVLAAGYVQGGDPPPDQTNCSAYLVSEG